MGGRPLEYREESEGDDRRKTGDRGYGEEAEVRQRRYTEDYEERRGRWLMR